MKIINTIWGLIVLISFTSCGDLFSNTSLVKDYIDDIDPTMSLGEAFDTYKYFKKTEWNEFTTDRGQEIVEFNGYYFEKDIIVRIQFLINKDWAEDENGNSFKLGYQGYKLVGESNSESKSFTSDNILENIFMKGLEEAGMKNYAVILRIYKNKKLYFPGGNFFDE